MVLVVAILNICKSVHFQYDPIRFYSIRVQVNISEFRNKIRWLNIGEFPFKQLNFLNICNDLKLLNRTNLGNLYRNLKTLAKINFDTRYYVVECINCKTFALQYMSQRRVIHKSSVNFTFNSSNFQHLLEIHLTLACCISLLLLCCFCYCCCYCLHMKHTIIFWVCK